MYSVSARKGRANQCVCVGGGGVKRKGGEGGGGVVSTSTRGLTPKASHMTTS